jgi:hypothetical protein
LLGELTHRVRNTLAVIQAIARHTMRNSKYPGVRVSEVSEYALLHPALIDKLKEGARRSDACLRARAKTAAALGATSCDACIGVTKRFHNSW